MKTIRIIPCLDCSFVNGKAKVVKGVKFENLQSQGDPAVLAEKYYQQGADEVCFLDITASLDSRQTMQKTVKKTAEQVFVPVTVGGGIQSLADASALFRAGADKVAVNSAALKRPELVREISREYGSQACVLAMDVKKANKGWEVYTRAGTQNTGKYALDWAKKGEELGAGELLVTSIDRDGTQSGYDLKLLKAISTEVNIPVIASGGAGSLEDMVQAVQLGKADAVLAASIFHTGKYTIRDVKKAFQSKGIRVRP